VPNDEAAITIDSLIDADLKGVGSHGLNRLPIYVKRIKAKIVKAKAEMVVEREAAAIAVVDGQHSVAQVIATWAMELAIQKACSFGIGAVLVKNSGHFGMASTYGLQAARQNMIGIVTSNVTPLMPAPGGATKLIGNNPLAIVAPTKGDPIVPDMAMSTVALGKLIVAKNQGEKIPTDWAVDSLGNLTDDPQAMSGHFSAP
jgi:LDH2 family malate/lactate/ureidoglycolate dehydrogenase